MTKYKKLGSLVLAGCMAASSLAMSAGAVNVAPEETDASITLAEHAGETLSGTAYYVESEDKVTQKDYEVEIPAGASQAMESILISDAAREAIGLPTNAANAARAARSRVELDSTWHTQVPAVNTGSASYAELFNVSSMPESYDFLEMDIVFTGGFKSMNFRVENTSLGIHDTNRQVYQLNIPMENGRIKTTFFKNLKYGNGYMYINKGNPYSVYASGTMLNGYTGTYSTVNGYLYGGFN